MTNTRESVVALETRTGHDAGTGELPEFKMQMPYQTLLLARMLQADYLTRIVETGVAPAQSFVLAELSVSEPLSQVELARRLDIGKATVGQTLNRLERAGMIRRERHKSDGRVTMVHLTDKGRAMHVAVDRAALEQRVMLQDLLGAETVGQLCDLLLLVTQRLASLGIVDEDVTSNN